MKMLSEHLENGEALTGAQQQQVVRFVQLGEQLVEIEAASKKVGIDFISIFTFITTFLTRAPAIMEMIQKFIDAFKAVIPNGSDSNVIPPRPRA
jgi:hypothetical protein